MLLDAKRTQTPAQYRVLSAPILMKPQQRQQEILEYLMEPAPSEPLTPLVDALAGALTSPAAPPARRLLLFALGCQEA